MNPKLVFSLILLQFLVSPRQSCALTSVEEAAEDAVEEDDDVYQEQEAKRVICKTKVLSKYEKELSDEVKKLPGGYLDLNMEAPLEEKATQLFNIKYTSRSKDEKVKSFNLLVKAMIRDYCYNFNQLVYFEVYTLKDLLSLGSKATSWVKRSTMSNSAIRQWKDTVNMSQVKEQPKFLASEMIERIFPGAFKEKKRNIFRRVGAAINRKAYKERLTVCKGRNYEGDHARLFELAAQLQDFALPPLSSLNGSQDAQAIRNAVSKGKPAAHREAALAEYNFMFRVLLADSRVDGMVESAVESITLLLKIVIHEYCRYPSHRSKKYIEWISRNLQDFEALENDAKRQGESIKKSWALYLDRTHLSVPVKKAFHLLIELLWEAAAERKAFERSRPPVPPQEEELRDADEEALAEPSAAAEVLEDYE